MAGHSHWASIKHKKKKEDKRRGKLFSRLSKQIMTAVREGGKDPETNLDLQYAMEAAKDANMPKDNIERAVLKGAGELEGQQVEPARFEGYGPGGAAVMVDCLTDNRNRTTAQIRKIFDDHGGELGANGCVAWLFETRGLVLVAKDELGEEEVFEAAIEAGAEDFEDGGDVYELSCDRNSFHEVRKALEGSDMPVEDAEITQVPNNYVELNADEGRRMLRLMDELEDNDDVANVYSNFDLPAELMDEVEAGG